MPQYGEIRLSAYDAYKLEKLSKIKQYSPNKLYEKKLKEGIKKLESSQ